MLTLVDRVWGLRAAAFRSFGPLLLVSGCADGPYLMAEEYITRGDAAQEQYMGGGCIAVQEGNGMGGGSPPTFAEGGADGEGPTDIPGFGFSYEGTGNAVRFTVSDGYGALLVDRTYDSDFLHSGERDEIAVDVTNGKMRFVHWGGAKCAETRAPSGD